MPAADIATRTRAVTRRIVRRLDVVATLLVCLPIAWHAARAASSDWVPIGDDAYFTIRSMDVLTEHHPWLGAWSSGSVGVDRMVNNLGPMQLDLLAPFTKLAPVGGTAIGVAVVNIAAIVTTAWLLARIGGRRATIVAMVPIGLLTWTMGSEMLITPRQHQFLVLPYLCFLVAAWAASAGDRWAMVPAVVTASLLTQTHLSYPILVASVGIVAVAGQIVAFVRSDDRGRWAEPWTTSVVVAVVLWSQTAYDQFFVWGNVTDVLNSPGTGEQPSLGTAATIVGSTLFDPGSYVRRGYADFDPEQLHSTAGAVAAVVLAVVLAAAAVLAWFRRRPAAAAGLAVGAAAVGAAIVDASQMPITVFGLTPFTYRWLWPTGTFLLVGAVIAISRLEPVDRALDDRRAQGGVLGVVALLAVANVPVSLQVPDPVRYATDQAGVAALMAQLDELDLEGPVVIDQSNMYFGHSYGYPTAVVLQDNGVEWRLLEDVQERRFGAGRVADGSETTTLVLWAGDEAVARRDDPGTVVYVDVDPPVAVELVERAP
ncbi:MAG: hypothetical protein KDB37_07985 [Ilumatobacter sp.]|nr:hypothetical protein [Ilumatobacter sp.]